MASTVRWLMRAWANDEQVVAAVDAFKRGRLAAEQLAMRRAAAGAELFSGGGRQGEYQRNAALRPTGDPHAGPKSHPLADDDSPV